MCFMLQYVRNYLNDYNLSSPLPYRTLTASAYLPHQTHLSCGKLLQKWFVLFGYKLLFGVWGLKGSFLQEKLMLKSSFFFFFS